MLHKLDSPSPSDPSPAAASLHVLPEPPEREASRGLSPLQGLLQVTRLLRSQGDPSALLDAIAGAVSDSLGFATVVVNLYRPAWDDFCVATVRGGERAALLGATSDWSVWRPLLDDAFLRRGAYLIKHRASDWADKGPDGSQSDDGKTPWHPEDTLLVPLVRSDGVVAGILSVDDPVSGLRPRDEDLDVLVAFAAHAALALEQADEARAAARHQVALAQLLEVSSRLHATASLDATLASVCAAIRAALGFDKVAVQLDDGRGSLRPVAAAGWDPTDAALDTGLTLEQGGVLLDPAFEREGCLLVSSEEVARRLAPRHVAPVFDRNGRGPHAWEGHWLIVPLYGSSGRLSGLLRVADPEDRLLPSANRLQALRAFANQVTTALRLAEQLETIGRSAEQLRQAQKMDAVGRLAGGLAHDFNNLLTAISGYGELALARMGADDEAPRRHVGEMQKAAETAAELTRQLLAFSRKQALTLTSLDLNGVVTDVAAMLDRLIGRQIELRTVLQPDLPATRADATQLQQVVLNLAINARDAMAEGGRLTIATSETALDERAAAGVGVEPGSYVVLTVTDTGVGMDAETRTRAFEPFFTTKEHGRGTGLGLATVYGIVKQCGGSVSIQSEQGVGSSFAVYLPAEQPEPPAASPSGGAEPATILLVDDQDLVRNVVTEMLSGAGFRVLAARSAAEAVEIASDPAARIDLLLTDVVLPDVRGTELAGGLRAERPGLRVLFTSGHSAETVGGDAGPDGAAFLEKPFTASALAEKVRGLLR